MMSTQAVSTEAMMLIDHAIITVWREYSIGILSTHDRSFDPSFGEKAQSQASELVVESDTESGVNESLMTQTITILNQVIPDRGDSQQNPNILADKSALTLVSATLEDYSAASQLITDPLTYSGPSEEISTRKRSTELLLGEQPIDAQLANEQTNIPHTESNTQESIVQSTQSYTLTATSSCFLTTTVRDSSTRLEEVLDHTWYEVNPRSESPSTHDKPPDYSFGEQHEKPIVNHRVLSKTIEGSFIMIKEEDENDESGEGLQPTEETVEQEMLMLEKTPTAIEVMNQYLHLIVKLCDGEIINAESGERIASLSQFIAANNLGEPAVIESDSKSQLSPQLRIDNEYAVLTQEDFNDTSQQPGQDEVYNAQLSLTLAQLNKSLVDH